MGYTNSPLVSYTKLSPNHSGQRKNSIDRISPHCVVGQCTVERLGEIFAPTSRQASSNYGIGYDGKVAMYVEEKNRSWCTSSSANDNRAITIEVASDTEHPYAMKAAAYNSLIELCVDICKRNGKTKLLWFADKNKTLNYKPAADEMVITVHRWFANKSCPGDWLYSRLGDLAAKVTAKLGGMTETPKEEPKPEVTSNIKKGDTVKIKSGAKYYGGKAVPAWVINKTWIVKECVGDRAVIDKSTDGKNAICSPINVEYLTVVKTEKPWVPAVGDIVKFTGNKHYVSANASNGSNCSAGEAKITSIYQLGKSKHPYHLVRTGKSGPYGWVDAGSFTKK